MLLRKAAPQQLDVNVSRMMEITAEPVARPRTAVDHMQVEIWMRASQFFERPLEGMLTAMPNTIEKVECALGPVVSWIESVAPRRV